MKIVKTYSHFNGLEHLQVHKPHLLDEIRDVIQETPCDTRELESAFGHRFAGHGWQKSGVAEEGQVNFVKNRIAVGFQMGRPQPPACDLFAKHLAAYVCDQIDVGVEILPMKSLRTQTNPEVPHSAFSRGQGIPAVPLILIGVDA